MLCKCNCMVVCFWSFFPCYKMQQKNLLDSSPLINFTTVSTQGEPFQTMFVRVNNKPQNSSYMNPLLLLQKEFILKYTFKINPCKLPDLFVIKICALTTAAFSQFYVFLCFAVFSLQAKKHDSSQQWIICYTIAALLWKFPCSFRNSLKRPM